MRAPDAAGTFYLVWVLGVLSWAALASKRRLRAAAEATGSLPISREKIFVSTGLSLVVLLALSIVTGSTFGYEPFAVPRLGPREAALGAAALAVQLALMLLTRALRPAEERRSMAVYKLVPRTRREWTLFAVVAVLAGIAEEASYRGVLWALLSWCLGSPWLAAAICVVAFAIAHAVQGWKSMLTIGLMAAFMHALVALTGTLVIAMIVHATYDLIAGLVGSWRLRRGDVDG